MQQHFSTNLKGIPVLAKQLASQIKGGETIALIGELGSGKTTFSKTLGKELGVKQTITSPTFVFHQIYSGKFKKSGKALNIHHLDLYRTKNFTEVKALGIQEFWTKPETITLIEWADKIKKYLPKKTLYITFHENN